MLKKFITLIINWAKTYTIKIFDDIIQLYNEDIWSHYTIIQWTYNFFI
jgi:hypothetical protein